MKIFLDGKLVDKEDAKISVFDHGLLYGDGIFEGIRFYKGRVFRLEEHIERLFLSARAILLKMQMTQEEVIQATLDTIAANGLTDGYVRLVVTRGVGGLGLNPFLCDTPSIFIIADGIQLYPEEFYTKGLDLITTGTRRPTPASLPPQVKSLNYLNNVMAKIECIQAGVMEGLMLNQEGNVAECTGDNVFIVKNGTVFTPLTTDGALDGITRQVIIESCKDLGIPIVERTMNRYDVWAADECFLSGTAAEVIPVVKLDSRPIGTGEPGEVTLKILARFRELTQTTGTPVAR